MEVAVTPRYGGNHADTCEERPKTGEIIIFFFAGKDCAEPGFGGWGIIQSEWNDDERELRFQVRSLRAIS